ncbi:cyclase family protein [Agrococcus sp. BE272]|uniref:cyclase family protein n=1 Tax=Agrococcus sp. BE272 TaxID=2817727 RepID=UPI0028631A37|nr:cyclase family protein [Agrococcus sp. BE272]MDR7233575.1 kynurenine formamidase [Agrococcus sp. BE272]
MNEHEERLSWRMPVAFPPPGDYELVDLSQPMYTGIPHHPAHPPYSFTLTKKHGDVVYPGGVSGAAEMITTSGHVGTHVDGFSHVARDGRMLHDVDIIPAQSYGEGMGWHSVHTLSPMFAVAHLVDLPLLLGRPLTPDDGATAELLDAWFSEREQPKAGEIVLIRTGWGAKWDDPKTFIGAMSGLPGVTLDGGRWLSARSLRAAGTDTISFEKVPNHSLDVHVHLLVETGISIIEALNLEQLVGRGIDSFFFAASPLHLRGATGSPIRPLAFVRAQAEAR